jgi:hypothetical protein
VSGCRIPALARIGTTRRSPRRELFWQ